MKWFHSLCPRGLRSRDPARQVFDLLLARLQIPIHYNIADCCQLTRLYLEVAHAEAIFRIDLEKLAVLGTLDLGGQRLQYLIWRNGALQLAVREVSNGFDDCQTTDTSWRASQRLFARREEGELQLIVGVQTVQPGEDLTRGRQWLARSGVQGFLQLGRGDGVYGRVVVDLVGGIGRVDDGCCLAQLRCGRRRERSVGMLGGRGPRAGGAEGQVLVGDRRGGAARRGVDGELRGRRRSPPGRRRRPGADRGGHYMRDALHYLGIRRLLHGNAVRRGDGQASLVDPGCGLAAM